MMKSEKRTGLSLAYSQSGVGLGANAPGFLLLGGLLIVLGFAR